MNSYLVCVFVFVMFFVFLYCYAKHHWGKVTCFSALEVGMLQNSMTFLYRYDRLLGFVSNCLCLVAVGI